MWSGPTFSVISLKVVKNIYLMHILHFKMSISASKYAIIISNIHSLMYCWNKLQHMQHKNCFFFFNVVKYDTSHLWQLIGSGLLKYLLFTHIHK